MKLSPEMIGALVIAAIGTAGFAWMAQRPAVESTALKFGIPDNSSQAPTTSTAATTETKPVSEPTNTSVPTTTSTPTTNTTLPVENTAHTSTATPTQETTPVQNNVPSQPVPAANTQNTGIPASMEKPVEVPVKPVTPSLDTTQVPSPPATDSGTAAALNQTSETVQPATATATPPSANTSEFPPKEIPVNNTSPDTTQLPESIEFPTNLLFDGSAPVAKPAPTQ